MVSLGASVGNNASVERLSVVLEGAKVPEGTHVVGNPAYVVKQATISENQSSCLLGVLKLLRLTFELYLFMAMMLLNQYLWTSRLPNDWRYTDLLKWTLLIVWFSVSSIGTSVILNPAYNFMMRILGAKIEGRALLYQDGMYEYSYVTVADEKIVDAFQITVHYVVYGDATLGPCKVSGVMHEGTNAANACIASEESESWRTFVGTYPHVGNTVRDEEMAFPIKEAFDGESSI
jgi:hypothetical protein